MPITLDDFDAPLTGQQPERIAGDFKRDKRGIPWVSCPEGGTVKSGKRKGEIKWVQYGRPSSFGKDIENTHNLQKWNERKIVFGMTVEDDLNTPRSRELWLEWRRRVDPTHWLDPQERLDGINRGPVETDPDRIRRDRLDMGERTQAFARASLAAGLSMVDDGLIPEHSFWGTTSLEAVNANGDICGVTTTSGLAWKIPGRAGDSPILGAGQYVDNDVGACGSTGRGEANLYNLTAFLIVEFMRQGMAPKDAGMAALKRLQANTIEPRLQNSRGLPNWDIRFFILNKRGDYAGVAMYGSGERTFAVCDENGARQEPLEGLLEGSPRD